MTRSNIGIMSSGLIQWIWTVTVVVMFMTSGSDTGTSSRRGHVVSAFVTPKGRCPSSPIIVTSKSYIGNVHNQFSSTVLHERQWNFNEGQGPFGLKKNAETWNGRVAQVCLILS
jgi:hypothetical protein